MPRVKYILYPGYVTSITDGQRHWIGALELSQLWKVKKSECAVVTYQYRVEHLQGMYPKAQLLIPMASGEYVNPRAV